MENPILSNPANTLEFPGVTQEQLAKLLDLARQNGAVVTVQDPNMGAITYHHWIWHVQAVYMLSPLGLTVQVDGHAAEVRSEITKELARITG